jgi:hypothetical protein
MARRKLVMRLARRVQVPGTSVAITKSLAENGGFRPLVQKIYNFSS